MISDQALLRSIRSVGDSFRGRLGVCARTVDDAREIRLAADAIFPAASSIKIFVLYALLAVVERGMLRLDDRLEVVGSARQPGSGVLYHLTTGIRPTIRDLATLMMMISDNTAMLMLVNRLGRQTINDCIESLGLAQTRCGDWSRFATEYADSMSFGHGSPGEFCDFLLAMRRGELLGASSGTIFWDILRIQKYIEPLRRLLPASPWAREFGLPEPVWVASKNGALDDCCCESGFVYVAQGGWAISVMLRGLQAEEISRAERAISEISHQVYLAWSPSIEGERQ